MYLQSQTIYAHLATYSLVGWGGGLTYIRGMTYICAAATAKVVAMCHQRLRGVRQVTNVRIWRACVQIRRARPRHRHKLHRTSLSPAKVMVGSSKIASEFNEIVCANIENSTARAHCPPRSWLDPASSLSHRCRAPLGPSREDGRELQFAGEEGRELELVALRHGA